MLDTDKDKAYRMLHSQAKLKIDLNSVLENEKKLAVAIRYRNLPLIEYFLQNGLTPETWVSDDYSAIHLAIDCHGSAIDTLHLFLRYKFDIHITDREGNNALHWIVKKIAAEIHVFWTRELADKITIFKILLASGCDLDQVNKNGKKPLDMLQGLFDQGLDLKREAMITKLNEAITEVNAGLFQYNNSLLDITPTPPEDIKLTKKEERQVELFQAENYSAILENNPFALYTTSVTRNGSGNNIRRTNNNNNNQPISAQSSFNNFLSRSQNNGVSFFSQALAINATQRNIIEGTLSFVMDDIEEKIFLGVDTQEPSMTLQEGIDALKSITNEALVMGIRKKLVELDIWDSIKQIRNIVKHPCPQNRYHGDGGAYWNKILQGRDPETLSEMQGYETGACNGIVYYYESGFGSDILEERQGLLGLTSRNDATAPNVTKKAVVTTIGQIIDERIADWLNKAAKVELKTSTVPSL